MLDSRRFFLGFFSAVALASMIYLVLFILLSQAGELSIDKVVAQQMRDKKTLFTSNR